MFEESFGFIPLSLVSPSPWVTMPLPGRAWFLWRSSWDLRTFHEPLAVPGHRFVMRRSSIRCPAGCRCPSRFSRASLRPGAFFAADTNQLLHPVGFRAGPNDDVARGLFVGFPRDLQAARGPGFPIRRRFLEHSMADDPAAGAPPDRAGDFHRCLGHDLSAM